jgi:hypothetical protein
LPSVAIDMMGPNVEDGVPVGHLFTQRRRNLAPDLRAVADLPRMAAYLRRLRALAGRVVAPRELWPPWQRPSMDRDWPSRIPGAPAKPSGELTFWVVMLSTRWRRNLDATVDVKAAIGGHSLGRVYGPITTPIATLARVRVRGSLNFPGRGRRRVV